VLQDARLAKTTPGRNARFAGRIFRTSMLSLASLAFGEASSGYAAKEQRLGTGYKVRVIKIGL